MTTIRFRRATAAAWSTANPILGAAEPGYETDTGLMKLGDGVTAWSALGYFTPQPTANLVTITQPFLTPASGASLIVWRVPRGFTVTAVRGYRVGGTGATVNASKNGADLLAAPLSLTSAGAWSASTTIQNGTLAAGDAVAVTVVTQVGSPSAVTIQVDAVTS